MFSAKSFFKSIRKKSYAGSCIVTVLFHLNPFVAGAQLSPVNLKEVRQALNLENSHSANYYISQLQSFPHSKTEKKKIDILLAESLFLDEKYDQALSLVKPLESALHQAELAECFLLEGKILNRNNQFKESLYFLQEAEKLLKENPKNSNLGELNRWLGSSFSSLGNYSAATTTFHKSLSYFKKDSLSYYVKIAQVHIVNGLNYKRSQQHENAEQEYLSAIRILENSPLAKFKELSRAYINLANVYNEQTNYGAAQTYYQKAIVINTTSLNDPRQLSILYNNIANFYQDFGNLSKSKEYYDKWYLLFEKGKWYSDEESLKMLINYARFFVDILEFEQADRLLWRARQFSHEDSDPAIQALFYFAHAKVKESLKQTDSVDFSLTQVDKLLRYGNVNDPEIQTQLLYRKGVYESNLKNYTRADSLLRSAIQQMRQNESSDLPNAVRSLGLNFDMQNEDAKALTSYQEALRLITSTGNTFSAEYVQAVNDIGMAYRELKQFDSASYYFTKAVKQNQVPGNESVEFIDAYEMLISNAQLLLVALENSPSEGNLRKAEFYAQTAYLILENKRKSIRSFEDQLSYNRVVREFFDIALEYYQKIFTLRGEVYYFNKMFETAEKARYQALQQALRHVRVGEFSGVTQKIVEEDQLLQKQIGVITRQIIDEMSWGDDANQDLLKEYNDMLVMLTKRHDKVIDSIKNNLPGLYNLKFSSPVASPQNLKADLLQQDMALVQYHIGFDKVYVMVISKEGQSVLVINNKIELLKSIRRLSNINKLQLTKEFIPVAHELYKRLLKPVDSLFAKKKINHYVIIPDGEVNYVPFDVLITKPASELNQCKFLLNDKILSYGYSSTLLWQEFSGYQPETQQMKMLAYAPAFSTDSASQINDDGFRSAAAKTRYATYDFQPLHSNVTEVKGISTIVEKRGFQNEAVINDAADEASFKTKDLNQYQIIHLATHGFVDYPTTLSSGIAFSFNQTSKEDGILFMDEIFSLRFHTHLVCLSACQTGFGQVDVGEGMMSMTRAFLYAGAKNLVVSLWVVQDNSTARLMENFYKQFVKSKSISLSLRKAKLQMLQEGEFSHPYNWAGFIHVGMN